MKTADYKEVLSRVCKEKLSGIILKPEQKEVIISLFNGKDVFVVLQTGFGKSLIFQSFVFGKEIIGEHSPAAIGPMQDPVTWYGINYTGTQMTQWDFQNKGKSGWTGASSFVLKVPLRHLRPSLIYFVPCDWMLQRAIPRHSAP